MADEELIPETRMLIYVYNEVRLNIESELLNENDFIVMFKMAKDSFGNDVHGDFVNGKDLDLANGVYGVESTRPITVRQVTVGGNAGVVMRLDVVRKDPWPKPPPPPPAFYGNPPNWADHADVFLVPSEFEFGARAAAKDDEPIRRVRSWRKGPTPS